MKYIKLVTIVAFTWSFLAGCVVDDLKEVTPAVPGANLYAPADIAFLFQQTETVSFDVELAENPGATVSSILVNKQLITTQGDSPVSQFTVSGSTISQAKDALFADVPVGGNVLSEDDLEPGDAWIFDYQLQMSDGRVLSIPSSGSTTVTFQCASDLAGSYDAIGSGSTIFGTFPPGAFNNTSWDGSGVVTLTEVSAGVYEMDKSAGDFYIQYWGGDPEVATFRDVCDVYTIDEKTDQWGYFLRFDVTNNGDGTITVDWINGYDDKGTYTLTPQ
ncbi:MAG: hypothetical protein ACR2MX_07700 [Cyclobacteriaceae bacterium]